MGKRIILFIAMYMACAAGLYAQEREVSGKLVDQDGTPVAGAVVYEKGRETSGTVADDNGKWSLRVSSGKAQIIFSCLGYMEAEVAVGGRAVIDHVMQADNELLEAAELVSIGYGSVAKRDLTGSVSSVSMSSISTAPVTNFDQALTGRIAGVYVSTSDGAVGSTAEIVIRGSNSLTQSSSPLYVIDGFLSESSMATSISPSDIETIDVLKDASATAIYGARGANGVIVIQTKKGVEGKTTVNLGVSSSLNVIANKTRLMDGYDFVCLQSEIYDAKGQDNEYLKGGYTLQDYADAKYVDWQDMIYRPALVMDYSLSVSGGSGKTGTSWRVNFSALDQDGIIVGSNFQKYSAKVNLTQKIGKKLKMEVFADYARSITDGTTPTSAQQSSSASGWLVYSVWGYRPLRPLYLGVDMDAWMDDYMDSDAQANDYRFNPAKTVRNEYRKTIFNNLSGNASLSWYITPKLTLKVSGGYRLYQRKREEFNGSQTYSGFKGSPSGKGINGSINWTDTGTWQNDNTLTWRDTFGREHHFTAMAGFSLQGEKSSYDGVASQNMSTESLGLKGMHTGQYQVVIPWQRNWRMMSGFARISYDYGYRYYLTATFRADGSSKFPPSNRWGFFPSASVAWNFDREPWMEWAGALSNGKVRASYGLTGNNRTTTPYDFYSQVSTSPGTSSTSDYFFSGEYVPGYAPSSMANENLKWETTGQVDIGLDLGFFSNRIKLTADWYMKHTRDLLLQAIIPASSGFTSEMRNIGSIRNSGVELTVDAVPVMVNGFEWDISFNIAMNRNVVTALSDGQHALLSTVSWDQRFNSQYPYISQVGMPAGLMYGFIYEGTYKAADFNSNNLLNDDVPYMESVGKEQTRPGDPRYCDINGDGVINDADRTVIGCGIPVHTGGLGSSFRWKGIDLNVFFNWSYGNNVLNANRLYFENAQQGSLNQLASYNGRFNAATNPDSDIPRVLANGTYVYSSRVVEDASYLRLRSISLGYTLPGKLLARARISKIRIAASVDNIFTWTSYSGADPEVSTRSSVLTPGFDWSAYPRARGGSLSLDITF